VVLKWEYIEPKIGLSQLVSAAAFYTPSTAYATCLGEKEWKNMKQMYGD